jgi:formylmethanofuran dehydrogenase subunit E-like metal-binding protein
LAQSTEQQELGAALVTAAESVCAEPKQDTLPLVVREEATAYDATPAANFTKKTAERAELLTDVKPSPGEELLKAVREILRRELVEARTEEAVASLLAVTKSQAKAWLVRLVADGALEKISKPKPVRYRTATASGRVF